MHTICLLMQRDSFYAAEINARSQAATGRSEMTGGTTSRISTKTGIRGLSVSQSCLGQSREALGSDRAARSRMMLLCRAG